MLIGHWPLNGNTNDYSGYGKHGTILGTLATDANGKIGSTYVFTNTDNGVNIANNNFAGLSTYTMAIWVNPAGNHLHYNGALMSSGNWNTTCWNFGVSQDNTGIDVAGAGYNKYITYALTLNTWTHLLCTVSGNISKLYINGTYYGQLGVTGTLASDATNTCIGRETYAGGYFAFNGKLNDARIYDQVLSEYEIKELAKAKILHYTFDDPNEEPTTNFVSGPLNPDNGWGTRTHTTTLVTDIADKNLSPYTIYGYKMDNTVNASSWSGNAYSYTNIRTHACTSGLKYTGSVWCYVSPASNLQWAQLSSEGAGSGASMYDMTKKGTWQRLINTFTASSTANSSTHLYFSLYGETTFANMAGYIIFAAPQFEEKDHATPFVNGTRNIGISDISGYKNNGTVVLANSPTYSTGRIGSGAFYFNGSQVIKKAGLYIPEAITMLTWFKASGAGYGDYHIPLSIGDTLCEISVSPSGELRTGYTISGVRQVFNTAANLFDNVWHLIGSTYDGSLIRVYKDGVMINSASYPGTLTRTANGVGIGQFDGSTTYGTIGYQDDVRIYATALSATDILAIYNKRANLDNLGNFMSNEIVERVNNAELISQAIVNKTFTDGLSEYEQQNCTCNLTDDGYQIYRAPNLDPGVDGYTMWGGFLAYLPEKCFIPNHNYKIQFKMKGQTSNDIETYFGYEAGWTTMGVELPSWAATKDKSYTNFQSTIYQPVVVSYTVASGRYAYPTWSCIITSGSTTVTYNGKHPSALNIVAGDFLVDSAYFPTHTKVVSVTANTSFVVDKAALSSATANLQSVRAYDTYRHFKFGFTYQNTGALGTNLYIKDFKVIDITEDSSENGIKYDGKSFFAELDEVTGTINSNATHEIQDTGSLVINGEFSEIEI